MRLKDKVVLITASTRGIGLACVKKCAKEGAKVYMAARNLDRAQEIADTLDGVKFVYNDATKPETFTSMVEDVVKGRRSEVRLDSRDIRDPAGISFKYLSVSKPCESGENEMNPIPFSAQ